jgi:hypothetical protein
MFAEFRLTAEIEKQRAQQGQQFGKWLHAFFKFFGTLK